MRAELVIDLNDLGLAIGRAKGRSIAVYPILDRVAEMWATFDIDVVAMHLVTTSPGTDRSRIAEELFFDAWWRTESALGRDRSFNVAHLVCAREAGPTAAPLGLDGLVVNTALSRSDHLAGEVDHEDLSVIVMSSSPHMTSAVTAARGVPVIIVSTTVPDPDLANVRLEAEPLAHLATRLSGDGPAAEEIALAGRVEISMNGRQRDIAELPEDAQSVVLVDPRHFVLPGTETSRTESPRAASLVGNIVSAVETLGLGTNPHLVELDPDRSEADVFALLYRFAHDHPNIPILIASSCPSVIAAAADPPAYQIANPRRIQRLCTPERAITFDDTPYVTSRAASRVVIEQRILDLLENPPVDQPTTPEARREATREWRQANLRRYVLLGAEGSEATPADSAEGYFLPLVIDTCTDFTQRPPALRPGLVVEAVLNEAGTEWTVVSDAIERRRRPREQNLTDEQVMAMRAA